MTSAAVLFQRDKVLVTADRLVVGDHAYAIRDLKSVRRLEDKPGRLWPLVLIGLGVLSALVSYFTSLRIYGGFILCLIGGAWIATQKPTHHLQVSTAAGDTDLLTTRNQALVDQVVSAVNQALAAGA